MTLAIPNDLKKEMGEFPIINWSEVAREAIREKLNELRLLKKISLKSKLTEKDALELGRTMRKGIALRHSK